MGLIKILQERARKNAERKAKIAELEKKTEKQFWTGYETGAKKRQKTAGIEAGMGKSKGGVLDTLGKIGVIGKGISESPLFENPFESPGERRERRHSSRSRSSKRKKSHAYRKRDNSEQPYIF